MAMNCFTVKYALDLYNIKQNLQNGMKEKGQQELISMPVVPVLLVNENPLHNYQNLERQGYESNSKSTVD